MGIVHLLGQLGYTANVGLGVDLLRDSAENADLDCPNGAYAYALVMAGEIKDVELPGRENYQLALHFLERAADLSFRHALSKLGNLYENGDWECQYSPQKSLAFYKLAARQGFLTIRFGYYIDT